MNMATRKPLVLVDGVVKELPPSDSALAREAIGMPEFDGTTSFSLVGLGIKRIVVSATEPSDPQPGDLWVQPS